MSVINLTAHSVVVLNPVNLTYNSRTRSWGANGEGEVKIIKEYPGCNGAIPRCSTTETDRGCIDNGVPLIGIKFGDITNLPEEVAGTFYIVSALVANAGRLLGRKDLLVPSGMVRDKDGKILGCTALAIE